MEGKKDRSRRNGTQRVRTLNHVIVEARKDLMLPKITGKIGEHKTHRFNEVLNGTHHIK